MPKPFILTAIAINRQYPPYLSAGNFRLQTLACLLLLGIFLPVIRLHAQDIGIRNPSLEGVPAQYRAPGQWLVVSSTPDVQPGITGVSQPASDGTTYAAFRGSAYWLEAIAQKLNKDMQNGKTYRLSMDMSFARGYDSATCYGAVAIYGGITLTDTLELLWQSGPFYNTEWKRFTAEFTPHRDYPYIVVGGDVRIACNNDYGIALAIDNLADTLRELPTVTYKVEPPCKGMSNGRIIASATGTYPPFTFTWEPLGITGNVLDDVPAGTYVLVTHARNGVDVRDTIVMEETEFNGNATIVVKGCAGESLNKIQLHTEGGTGPYEYMLNTAPDVKLSPEFDQLYAGTYSIIIRDARGCIDTLPDLFIPDPPPFSADNNVVTGMSCAGANDAQIIFMPEGGVPPYTYSLPGVASRPDSIVRNLSGGIYTYHITDAQECTITGNIDVPVATHPCAIYAPNAFSPDGDGINDVFRIKVFDRISDFRLSVYNRWGELLYTTTDVKSGWRGDYKGVPLPEGAYLWMVTYTAGKQQLMKQTGTVIIVK